MRVAILSLVAFVVLLAPLQSASAATPVSGARLMAASYQDSPTKEFQVDIDVNRGGGSEWYANPLWIAIGAVALLLFIALIVMASRGGGTTIVKE